MQYKTMILELLQQQPEIYDQLRKERKLLPTMEHYSKELRMSHEAWKQFLWQLRPGSDPAQVASEALEMAVKELADCLPSEFPDESQTRFLDAAMLFVRRRTPNA